jgi:formate hydrogenlyase transcriptional activator
MFLQAVEGIGHGMLIFGDTGSILVANHSAHAIFGFAPGALLGQPIEQLLPEVSRAKDTDLWTRVHSNGESRSLDVHQTVLGIRKDGMKVPLEIGLAFVSNGDARYVVVSLLDITERLNLEARLAATTHEHLGFQHLVSDLAGRFASVQSDALDELIVDSLRQIGEVLQLDQAILWRWRMGEPTAVPTHYWLQPSHPSPPAPFPIASIPYVMSKLRAGEVTWFTTVDDLPDPVDRETFRQLGPHSGAVVPVAVHEEEGTLVGLAFSSRTRGREWVPAIIERLRLVAGIISQALARQASQAALQKTLDELHQLRDRVSGRSVEPRREVKLAGASRLIVLDSAVVRRALAQVEQVALTPATVLLRGETGTGKELFAQAIHDLSPRHRRPMVVVSCAAIPTALIESELFGRERGAYTGALSRQIGRFEAASQSTLFLDEVGELPAEVQVKLLRVLQDHVIERLGSTQPIKVDVRIIAATHRDLEQAVRDGNFREDLFYRLNVFPIHVPPLRDRIEDIPGLVWAFVDEFSRSFGKTIESISRESMHELQRYPWPGNVRELRNVIERAVILATGRQLVVGAPRPSAVPVPQTAQTLAALEVQHIRRMLESTNWRVRGRGGAAERLGLKPTTLESRMTRLGIARKRVP